MATKQALLAHLSKPREVRAVPVEGLGEPLHVRMLNVGERLRLQAAIKAAPEFDSLVILSFGLSDERGEALFAEGETEDVGRLDMDTVEAATEALIELNKLRPADVDGIEKN